MQPKVSQEVLADIRVASIHPPLPPHDSLWSVSVNLNSGEGYNFSFQSQGEAEKFFETLKPAVAEEVAAGPRLYSHEQVKEIVAAAVIPVVEPETPLGIWAKVRKNWKIISLVVGLAASLTSNFLTLKVVLGPVKVPEIIVTLPDGSVVPSTAVEVKYKTPVTNGLPD